MRDLNNKSITREAQVRNREVAYASSVDLPKNVMTTPQRAKRDITTDEPMNKNVIAGADGGRACPGSRSLSGQTGCLNDAGVSGKCINLSGEASTGSLTGFESTHSKSSVPVSNGGDSAGKRSQQRAIVAADTNMDCRGETRPAKNHDVIWTAKRGLDCNQATLVERKVPAYNRLKTDCVARRSVWLRTRMAGGVEAGGVNAPRSPIWSFKSLEFLGRHAKILKHQQFLLHLLFDKLSYSFLG